MCKVSCFYHKFEQLFTFQSLSCCTNTAVGRSTTSAGLFDTVVKQRAVYRIAPSTQHYLICTLRVFACYDIADYYSADSQPLIALLKFYCDSIVSVCGGAYFSDAVLTRKQLLAHRITTCINELRADAESSIKGILAEATPTFASIDRASTDGHC